MRRTWTEESTVSRVESEPLPSKHLAVMPPSAVRHLLRNTPTIAPVPHRGLLYLSGSQSTEFINGLLASTVPKFGTGPFLSAFIHAQVSFASKHFVGVSCVH
jgi:hypothetical protein